MKTKAITCSKCESTDLAVRWHKSLRDCVNGCTCKECHPELQHIGEHLHYTCRRCGYSWRGPIKGGKKR